MFLQREAEKRDEKIKQWEQFKVISKSKTKPKVSTWCLVIKEGSTF